MRKLFLAVALALVALIAAPLSANADHGPVESFAAIDTAAGGVQTDSTVSTVTSDVVTLIQDGRATATAGTSAETTDLGLDIAAGGYLTVDYTLEAQDQSASGAIRFFAYYSADADTWGDAPDLVAVAPIDVMSESLVLHVPADATIGTVGVVYDTSNPSQGTVTFSDFGYSPGDDQNVVSLSFLVHAEPPVIVDPPDSNPVVPKPDGEQPATSDRTCDDFASAAELARHLEKFPGDADRLDGDDDGTYCDARAFEPVVIPTSIPAGLPAGSWAPVSNAGPDFAFLIPLGAAVAVGVVLAIAGAIVFNRATSDR